MVNKNTVRQYIDYYYKNSPNKIFIADSAQDLRVSYAKLTTDIWLIKNYFNKQGLTKGDKVGFMLDNGYDSVVLFLATIYHGLTIVPFNVFAGKKSIDFAINHSDCKVIWVSNKYQQLFNTVLNKLPNVFIYEKIDDLSCDNSSNANDNVADYINENTTAIMIYTSGTTGMPKGVVLTNKNIIAGATNTITAHGLTQNDRAFCVLPMCHVNAEVVTIIAPLVSGGSVVIAKKFSVSSFWQTIAKYECTWFSVVPTIISYLLNETINVFNKLDNINVRFGRSASAPLPQEVHKKFEKIFGIKIIETMGLSETSAQILSNPLNRQKYGSVGVAYGNKVKILNNKGNEMPTGTEGELAIYGDNVMIYYYKNNDATNESFTPDGWLLTGDLGYQDKDGFFFITGRKKELIIKGGENISPREIDEVLYEHDNVLEASAFGVYDKDYIENIAVCLYLKEKSTVTKENIISFCHKKLGEFKSPKYVFFADKPLPKGPSGKIQRLKIAKQYEQTITA